jgi:hypothetical protein
MGRRRLFMEFLCDLIKFFLTTSGERQHAEGAAGELGKLQGHQYEDPKGNQALQICRCRGLQVRNQGRTKDNLFICMIQVLSIKVNHNQSEVDSLNSCEFCM